MPAEAGSAAGADGPDQAGPRAIPASWPAPSTRPRQRSGVSAVELDENLALYDDVGHLLILLNTSAAAVWELCDGAMTVEQVVEVLAAPHPDEAELIAEDVRQTVRKLAELELVADDAEEDAGGGGQDAATP